MPIPKVKYLLYHLKYTVLIYIYICIVAIRYASYSPDGTKFLSAGADYNINVWDKKTRELLGTCKGHSAEIWSAHFNTKGDKIVSGSNDKDVKIWDAKVY
jgi:WD40 repeat protein